MASKATWLQPLILLLLGLRSNESLRWLLLLSFHNDWWVEEKNSWRLEQVCNGSSSNPRSNATVSPPFGSLWFKRRRLNQNCFWIDINEQIYLLNTLWSFSFYKIIVPQFSCNQMKLDQKRKFEIFFWRQIFHFLRVYLSTLNNWSQHNFFSFASIDLKLGMLTKIWFQNTLSKFCNILIALRHKIDF